MNSQFDGGPGTAADFHTYPHPGTPEALEHKAFAASENTPPGSMTDGVCIRSKLLVEGYAHGRLVAKAYRADDQSDWFIGQFINNRSWVVVGQLHITLSERLQRKVILSMLKELV